MSLVVTHLKNNAIPDGADSTQVQPSDWNTAHVLTGTISAAQGGTGIASYTVGDLLYASGATALSALADVATGSVLVSGGVGVAPAWSASPTLTSLTLGTSAAATGILRIPNNNSIKGRTTGATDTTLVGIDGGNGIVVGDSNSAYVMLGGTTIPASDASFSLGDGGHRWTSGYFGTALIVGTNPASAGDFRAQSAFTFKYRNALNTGDLQALASDSSNRVLVGDSSNTAFTVLYGGIVQFAGTTASFPALKRSTTSLQVRLADDSAFTYIAALGLDLGGNGGLYPSSDGVFRLQDAAGTTFNRLQFGGTTASFPALKRSGAGIAVRLADDSADAALSASSLVLSSNQFNAGYLRIGTADSVAANAGDLVVNRGGNPGTGVVYFGGSAALHYLYYDGTNFNLTDSLIPGADNTVSLGTSSHRWQSAFLSTALVVGTNPATQGVGRFANNTGLYWRNAANSSDLVGLLIDSSNNLYIGSTGVVQVAPNVDNSITLGATGTRWSIGYFGTALIMGSTPALAGAIRVPHGNSLGPVLMGRNVSNTADVDLIRWGYTADTFELGHSANGAPTGLFGSRIPIAGLTASFPALKRDTIFLQLRLGDDSGVSGAVTASLPAAAAGRDGIIGFDTTLNAFVYYVGGSRFKLVGTAF